MLSYEINLKEVQVKLTNFAIELEMKDGPL